ncbi:ATPase [Marinomonas aquimarina]|nr:ATPase [Marinomonas aquimarina]
MVLNYLSEHEQQLTKVIQGFELKGEEKVLNTWCYEYVQKYPITQSKHCDEPFASLNAQQIMDLIIDQHQQVVELYRYLASRAETTSTMEMLSALSSMEEHEIKRMVQSSNRFSDM